MWGSEVLLGAVEGYGPQEVQYMTGFASLITFKQKQIFGGSYSAILEVKIFSILSPALFD